MIVLLGLARNCRQFISQFTMTKRKGDELEQPAPKRFLSNPDAQGVLLRVMAQDMSSMQRVINDLQEEKRYLHRQVERLDGYTQELEGRMAAMEVVLSSLLSSGNHDLVEAVIYGVRESQEYDMTDLDRLLAEWETEDEGTDWFDDWLAEAHGEM